MPIYRLGENTAFPPAQGASRDGIVAVGGDLSAERLLNAYASGIFPWYSGDEPIIWWSPNPRLVLYPNDLHVSESMKKILKKNDFQLTLDHHFAEVIENCRMQRVNQPGTWITDDMRDAYVNLHNLGFAHSVEVTRNNQLVGGLYGIALGKCFFGESMFCTYSNASKFAFIRFVHMLRQLDFLMVDCQVPTNHLKSLGAKEIPRKVFLAQLKIGLEHDTLRGKWNMI